ncbi:LpqB family beta-propeller domain-containing protein [Arthrobacter sp. 35W]|uniref:LpqB family beta-propeller domain-containing protein n=1 Tax=Arthrobacter sp. 35W TaxID=1132441 RepID=UPI000400D1E4|nr:LpqB family beta-propeller domain-containing protein [Arthrobacter sp. 35W]
MSSTVTAVARNSPAAGAAGTPWWRAARALRAVAVAAVVLLATAGCATIPTSGPVGKSDPLPVRNNPVNIDFQQQPPVPGAGPEAIIEGFVAAGTGVGDDFQVARQFLAPALAGTWKADRRTLVYNDNFKVAKSAAAGEYTVDFAVASVVDASGILAAAAAGAVETVRFTLGQVDGQWRITSVPDGVMLQAANFATIYSPYTLYFYDPGFTFGVPDVRWLAGRASTTATSIVRAMLDGPAPYLKGAVASAFPDGIRLARDSVPVNNGVAQVDLTAEPLLAASVAARQQMQAQLLVTLQRNLNTVTSVTLRADARDIDLGPGGSGAPALVINDPVSTTQVAVAKDELVAYDGGRVSPIEGLGSLAKYQPSFPAVSYDQHAYAFLTGDRGQVYAVAPGQPEYAGAGGVNLTPPSYSPLGWVWTASGDGSGRVQAFKPAAGPDGLRVPTVQLRVQWLLGRTVTALRISRDGSRVLVVSELNGVSTVQISGILRTGEVPKELTTPITLPSTVNPNLGAWVSETSVVVGRTAASGPAALEVLDLKSSATLLAPLDGVQWLSAGSGVLEIHAQTAHEVFVRVGNAWGMQSKDVGQASFSG